MGQYYKPIFLKDRKTIDTYTSTDPTTGKEVKTKAFFYSHKYGNGLKLMEHSYVGNHLVNAVNNYLLDHNGGRLVWAGDYADEEPVRLPMAKTLPIWQKHVAEGLTTLSHKQFRLTSPLCIDKENGHTLYHKCGDGDGILDYDCSERDAICYYVNHDKKQVVELWETVVECDGYRVHPLPLLTCEGNGRGGGDYWGSNQRYVGTWARDFIQPYGWGQRDTVRDLINNKGYTKIYPCFFERYALKDHIKGLTKLISVAIQDFGQGMDGTLDIKGDKEYLTELHEVIKAIPDIPAEYRNRPKPKAEPATSKA